MRLHPHTVQNVENALKSAKTCVSQLQAALVAVVPECPAGFKAVSAGYFIVRNSGALKWSQEHGWQRDCSLVGPVIPGEIVAVPIIPKPESVKLTDQEKIAGWRGPSGFRLQTFQNRETECIRCKRTIRAGERLARWRIRLPEGFDRDTTCGKPGTEENHAHAHVDCLYSLSRTWKGFGMIKQHGLIYTAETVPKWLQEKREKFDKQH